MDGKHQASAILGQQTHAESKPASVIARKGKQLQEMREMLRVLKTTDNKKIVIDVDKDDCIYEDRRYNATRGVDLYAHKAKSEKVYLYMYRWSQWENEDVETELCTENEAADFLISRSANGLISEHEVELAAQYGIDLLEETG
jgi:hypothetical protein